MTAALGRLKTRSEFLRVAEARRKWVAPGLILQARRRSANAGAAHGGARDCAIRVGYTASRKVGNAVARNRARRRLRAVVDAVLVQHGEACHDYVVIARGATVTRPFPALRADLVEALARTAARRPKNLRRGRPEGRAEGRAEGTDAG